MNDREFYYFNWRIDQVHKMVADLARRLGQDEYADDITRFHNDNVVTESQKLITAPERQ